MVFTQITPAFASWDSGNFKKVTTSSLYMRSSYSTSSSIIMTMSNNEAIVDTRDWYDDGTYHWISCKGWNSSIGSIVNGWAVSTYISFPLKAHC